MRFVLTTIIAFLFVTPHIAQATDDETAYRLNPGDQLHVSIWREDGMDRQLVVLPDGAITFPLAGRVMVAGKTSTEIEALLEAELAKTMRSPKATVAISAVDGNRAFLLGKVQRPGSYVLSAHMTVPQLISMAGGLAEFAKEGRIVIVRGTGSDAERIRVNLSKLLNGDTDQTDYTLKAGDLVIVP